MDPLPLGRCVDRDASRQCSRWATIVCGHCQRQVCVEHHEVHQRPLQLRVHRLTNELNHLREETFAFTDQLIKERIEQWKETCREEIDRHSTQMIDMLEQLQSIDQTIGQPLTDLLRTSIQINDLQRIEKQYDQLHQTVKSIRKVLRTTPEGHVILDDQWMRRRSTSPIDQFFTSPTVKYPLRCCPGPVAGHFSIMNVVLLVFQIQPSLALLLFQADRFVIDVEIDHFVNDLCWSETTEVFLVATNAGLYEFHPGDHRLTRIEQTFSGKLLSLTCSDTDVFIVQASEMILSQYDVNRPFDRRGQWAKTDLIHPRIDRTISSIRINQKQTILGMTVEQTDGQWRVDLFSVDTKQRLISGPTFDLSNGTRGGFCLLTAIDEQWLVHHTSNAGCQIFLFDQTCQLIDHVDRESFSSTVISADRLACLDSTGAQIYRRERFY